MVTQLETADEAKEFISEKYKYGFVTDIETEKAPKGRHQKTGLRSPETQKNHTNHHHQEGRNTSSSRAIGATAWKMECQLIGPGRGQMAKRSLNGLVATSTIALRSCTEM